MIDVLCKPLSALNDWIPVMNTPAISDTYRLMYCLVICSQAVAHPIWRLKIPRAILAFLKVGSIINIEWSTLSLPSDTVAQQSVWTSGWKYSRRAIPPVFFFSLSTQATYSGLSAPHPVPKQGSGPTAQEAEAAGWTQMRSSTLQEFPSWPTPDHICTCQPSSVCSDAQTHPELWMKERWVKPALLTQWAGQVRRHVSTITWKS